MLAQQVLLQLSTCLPRPRLFFSFGVNKYLRWWWVTWLAILVEGLWSLCDAPNRRCGTLYSYQQYTRVHSIRFNVGYHFPCIITVLSGKGVISWWFQFLLLCALRPSHWASCPVFIWPLVCRSPSALGMFQMHGWLELMILLPLPPLILNPSFLVRSIRVAAPGVWGPHRRSPLFPAFTFNGSCQSIHFSHIYIYLII